VTLKDGTFVSLKSDSDTPQRWSISTTVNNETAIQLLGSFVGHSSGVSCAVEVEKENKTTTLITGSYDGTLKEWNMTTYECIKSEEIQFRFYSMIKTNDNTRLICGLWGAVEIRRTSDLGLISLTALHFDVISCICELKKYDDGDDSHRGSIFVSGSYDETLKLWNNESTTKEDTGSVIQIFSGHSGWVTQVIELRRNIIVSGSMDCRLKVWNVITGHCLQTLTLHAWAVRGLQRLLSDTFVSASWDKTIRVWNERGECLYTATTQERMTAMARLGDHLITAGTYQLEVRRLKWYLLRVCN